MLLSRTKLLKSGSQIGKQNKSSIKGYKTWLSRTKYYKSKSIISKQNQIKCKRIKNTAIKNKTTKK